MEILEIKELEIPTEIKNYKTSKSIRIYFKGNVLNITKPTRLSKKRLLQILKDQEDDIYNKYKKILDSEIDSIKQWKTGEKIYYRGEEFSIVRTTTDSKQISIALQPDNKILLIKVPQDLEQNIIKQTVDKAIKKLFKNNTEVLIVQKLPYWSEITGLKYNEFKIRDATTRYGSCMPSKKNVYFSSRLIMLPDDKVDAIIVHELCHMKFKYHNKDFYNLVQTYIPDYKEIDEWLKQNGKIIMF